MIKDYLLLQQCLIMDLTTDNSKSIAAFLADRSWHMSSFVFAVRYIFNCELEHLHVII